MKERSFHDRIHTIGRLTVICALVSFMAVPFVLAMVNHIPMNIPQILQNAFPFLPCPVSLSNDLFLKQPVGIQR